MTLVHSFAPIADSRATRLILGSMPGKASLTAGQYYAHPQNRFWPMMEAVLGVSASLSYEERCLALRSRDVAVWDVLKMCTRTSSLDSDIVESSTVANDFAEFFLAHPRIEQIYFNGAKAQAVFQRHVVPTLTTFWAETPQVRLPSTSPANASIPLQTKLAQWQQLNGSCPG
jgi:TDG/mug DNA glycosylase family protein